jgi:hypothetical protein
MHLKRGAIGHIYGWSVKKMGRAAMEKMVLVMVRYSSGRSSAAVFAVHFLSF